MGQRELFLIILTSIITGLAIFVGISIYKNQAVNFEERQYDQIMVDLAEQAQAWYIKPIGIGGGGRSYSGISFIDIPCPLSNVNTPISTNCSDDTGDHQLIVEPVESHHFRIHSTIKIGPHFYLGIVDVKADSGVFVGKWRKLTS